MPEEISSVLTEGSANARDQAEMAKYHIAKHPMKIHVKHVIIIVITVHVVTNTLK